MPGQEKVIQVRQSRFAICSPSIQERSFIVATARRCPNPHSNRNRILKKLVDEARWLPGEAAESPKRSQWKDTARGALEHAGASDSLLESFDSHQAFAAYTGQTEADAREQMNSNLSGMAAVLQSAIDQLGWQVDDEETTATLMNTVKPTVSIFISYSSKDLEIATALIELLRNGLGLRAEDIRCSSVDGYRLPGGVHTETQLRQEVNTAKAFIGLITKESLKSPYVMFELGARWGAGLHMIPLLAGVDSSYVKGPLAGINALSCGSAAQIHQLLGDLAAELGLAVGSAAAFVVYVERIIDLCK